MLCDGRQCWAGSGPRSQSLGWDGSASAADHETSPWGPLALCPGKEPLVFVFVFAVLSLPVQRGVAGAAARRAHPPAARCLPLVASPVLRGAAQSCHQQAPLVSAGPPPFRWSFLKHRLLALAQHFPRKEPAQHRDALSAELGRAQKGWQRQCNAMWSAVSSTAPRSRLPMWPSCSGCCQQEPGAAPGTAGPSCTTVRICYSPHCRNTTPPSSRALRLQSSSRAAFLTCSGPQKALFHCSSLLNSREGMNNFLFYWFFGLDSG